jgi:hypothetical protein
MKVLGPTDHAGANPVLDAHAVAIRALGKQTIENVIEIGRRLKDCKRIVGHGNWLPWLEREFGWTDKTAENFINVHKLTGKSEKFSNLSLPVSGLNLLAAPSTPNEARDEIMERAEVGKPVTVADVKQTIAAAKGRQQPAHKPRKASKPHKPELDDVEVSAAARKAAAAIEDQQLDRVCKHADFGPRLRSWRRSRPAQRPVTHHHRMTM